MPTSTNLGLVTPASTDYVASGATAMTTLANGVDAYYGNLTTYTPTIGSSTGGTGSGRFVRMGKLGFLVVWTAAGTAAATTITISLPSGWTSAAYGVSQPFQCHNGTAVAQANVAASATVITVRKDAAGTLWTVGDSIASLRLSGWLALA